MIDEFQYYFLFFIIFIVLVTTIIVIINIFIIKNKLFNNNDLQEIIRFTNEIIRNNELIQKDIEKSRIELENEIRTSKQETTQYIQTSFNYLGEMLSSNQRQSAEAQDKRLQELNRQLEYMTIQNEKKLENIRLTMENKITTMQEDNSKKLDQMRAVVDEKLQKTLEDQISQSFKLVSDRLEQVYKGLGEMQNLASGVGDLKKVLSNVKTRGILGEYQLGAILEQILSKEQYEENISTKKGSSERVEFAVKLPGDEESYVYLPIDAKFPADTYTKLIDAYDTGNQEEVEQAVKLLERSIKNFAKSINDKYIEPPNTTEFAIMFLPFEGLYAEVVRRGLVETLQRDYKINIAGPTTMAAILNSLQMGFKTLAIQKHSSDVWNILGAVKTEFDKFGTVLTATQQRINQANAELDKLIGTRTRKIQSKLRNIASISDINSKEILGIELLASDQQLDKDKDKEE
ncbi:DNA recombination protein RmuC [Anaerovorax odorimutans]|uniref:DNA recombination protein RmuC n=1 Tax=Anaerovorax odorimutans TaxID=109327 RepID=UPI00040E91F7|nr:DNA recombination protein RmuC [Anaerovorax odorimutans]